MIRSIKRVVLATLKGAVIVYLMVVAILFFMQRELLFHRTTAPPMLNDASLVQRREIVCLATADGLNLRAWYFRAARPDARTVLFLHGNAGDIGNHLPFARFLIDAGYGVLALEYRGYGGNPGSPSEAGLMDDARAGFAFLQSQDIADRGIVLFGESLGTGVAVAMAAEYAVGAMILRSPYTSMPDVAAEAFWYLPARWLVRDRFDSLSKIARSKAPLFIFHGADDALIPIRLGQELFAAASEPKTWLTVEGVGHNDVQTPEAERAVLDFLAGLPPGPPADAMPAALPPMAACGG
ncbi:alpha/beta hydrolase [Dongia sedimenti]|uniref:Alpha/beta hydrolase n=1 Tax=Dongia sedimenti TaxID=3064282 RepID=A0ABU0YPB1_9PROT|nr:alpha/beta hydrolase [Rhodospirillaceae bacterium R-7]